MSAPIKRLDLEFIPSNVTGFDHIVKITIVRTPGMTGLIEFILLNKYIISDTSLFEDEYHYLQYMSNNVYMSENIFMGGIDLRDYSSDYATLQVRKFKLEDFKFLLDYTINPDTVLMYNMQYRYEGISYTTPYVMSYKPVTVLDLGEYNERACITLRNLRYKGPNESAKYTDMHKEIYCDIRRNNELKTQVEDGLTNNAAIMDSDFNSLYNIIDSIQYYKQTLVE